MVDVAKLKKGDKVHYMPEHYIKENKYENGIVKEVPGSLYDSVRVVYNCNGDWVNYDDYTSALTNVRDLHLGWKYD